ncbi:MFS transporter [Fimbriiglobus ruber]|nr:MFS transporter [Fimbriiglobus ruber]
MSTPAASEPLPARPPSWKWWVCAVLLLATFLNYADRQVSSVSMPVLKAKYQIAERRIGILEGCFGFAFAAGSIVFGAVADRVGPRRLYPVVLAGWSAAGIATAFAGQDGFTDWLVRAGDDPGAGPFRWVLTCRTALGFFEAGHWPCALLTVRQILTAKDRPFGNALLQSGASLGAIAVPVYIEIADRANAGWEFAFWSVGIAGLMWVPLWASLIRRGDLEGALPPAAVDTSTASWAVVVRQFVGLAIVISCLNVSWQFLRAWLPLFLQDYHGLSPTVTRLCVFAYFIATDVGCIAAGLLVKLLAAYGTPVYVARRIGFTGFTGLVALAAVVPFVDSKLLMVALLMIAGGGILGLHPYYYAFVQELSAARMGLLSGTLAATGWIASSIFQIEIGAHIQEMKNYNAGLFIAGLAPLIALVALLTLVRRPA